MAVQEQKRRFAAVVAVFGRLLDEEGKPARKEMSLDIAGGRHRQNGAGHGAIEPLDLAILASKN